MLCCICATIVQWLVPSGAVQAPTGPAGTKREPDPRSCSNGLLQLRRLRRWQGARVPRSIAANHLEGWSDGVPGAASSEQRRWRRRRGGNGGGVVSASEAAAALWRRADAEGGGGAAAAGCGLRPRAEEDGGGAAAAA